MNPNRSNGQRERAMYYPPNFSEITAAIVDQTQAAHWSVKDAHCLIAWIVATLIGTQDETVRAATADELRNMAEFVDRLRFVDPPPPSTMLH